jgi:hypothetical protein
MKKHDKGGHAAGTKPVADLVNALLEDSRKSRVDGPSSMLYGARAQLSTTLNQAGTLLAKIDREVPPAKPTLLQSVLGLASSNAAPKKRSWFFAAKADGGSLTAKRIEALLKETEKDGTRLSFEKATAKSGEDVHCVLPEGATDPVCEPRR